MLWEATLNQGQPPHSLTLVMYAHKSDKCYKTLESLDCLLEFILYTHIHPVAAFCLRGWTSCVRLVMQSPDFNKKFVNTREHWSDDDEFLESGDQRLPLSLFASQEVEAIFSQHIKALQAEVKRQE